MANIYNLSETLTNLVGGNIKLTLEPDSGYELPALSDIVVTGGSIVSYDDTTGELVVTPGVTSISVECPIESPKPYLTFSSPNSFTLYMMDYSKGWNGTIEYSTDTLNWSEWNGSEISSGTNNKLYLRGTGNTRVSGSTSSSIFKLTGSNISCNGNIENLLDYQTVALGNHPTMTEGCYSGMFMGCSALITAPELPATTLTRLCYSNMFIWCSSLTTVPALPATTLAEYCYDSMFDGCSSLIISDTATSEATYAWRIPSSGTFTNTYSQHSMFGNCAGTRSSDNMAGQAGQSYTYYTQNEPVS